jgi:hypothetical protein
MSAQNVSSDRLAICMFLAVATVAFGAPIYCYGQKPDPWNAVSDQPSNVEVRLEHNERIARSEAHFRVSVTKSPGMSVFSTGIIYESGPRLYPVYLEQQGLTSDWHIVQPCIDAPPPQVIKLDPGVPMLEDLVLKIPLGGVCKERNPEIEGKFRFRVDYFETEAQARLYLKL